MWPICGPLILLVPSEDRWGRLGEAPVAEPGTGQPASEVDAEALGPSSEGCRSPGEGRDTDATSGSQRRGLGQSELAEDVGGDVRCTCHLRGGVDGGGETT